MLETFIWGPSITKKSCSQWFEISTATPSSFDLFGPSDMPRGFDFSYCTDFGSYWEYRGDADWIYHTSLAKSGQILAQIPEYESAWRITGYSMRGQIIVFSILWAFVLTINYVFWDRFRILPWK